MVKVPVAVNCTWLFGKLTASAEAGLTDIEVRTRFWVEDEPQAAENTITQAVVAAITKQGINLFVVIATPTPNRL
jgi:hypothetical protein